MRSLYEAGDLVMTTTLFRRQQYVGYIESRDLFAEPNDRWNVAVFSPAKESGLQHWNVPSEWIMPAVLSFAGPVALEEEVSCG